MQHRQWPNRTLDRAPIWASVDLRDGNQALIVRTFEALKGVRRVIVHVYNSISKIQRKLIFGRDREGIKAIAVEGARLLQQEAARDPETEWVFQYSPESFSNTEWDYAVEVCDAVIDVRYRHSCYVT